MRNANHRHASHDYPEVYQEYSYRFVTLLSLTTHLDGFLVGRLLVQPA